MESRDGQGEQGNDGAVVDRMPAGNLLLPQGCFRQSNEKDKTTGARRRKKIPALARAWSKIHLCKNHARFNATRGERRLPPSVDVWLMWVEYTECCVVGLILCGFDDVPLKCEIGEGSFGFIHPTEAGVFGLFGE